jgi:hypothetical protein
MELKNEEMGEIVVAEPLRDLCEAEYPSIMAAFHYYCAFDGDMGPTDSVSCRLLAFPPMSR